MDPAEQATHRLAAELAENPDRLVSGLTTPSGEAFLQWLVEYLARTVGVAYAFVGELWGEDWNRVRTLALCTQDGFQKNIEYDLLDTLCTNLIQQKVCVVAQGVAAKYPKDVLLQELGIESYVGISLLDELWRPLGLIVLLDTRPMDDSRVALGIASLELFQARAQAELKQRRAVQDLRLVMDGMSSADQADSRHD